MKATEEANLAVAAKSMHYAVLRAQENLGDALAERRRWILMLRQEGWSLQRIADLLGVTKTAVANMCRAAPTLGSGG